MKKGLLERRYERLQQWVTPKRVSVLLTIVYILSLIPLLWISWYNYPSADDYTIGNNCRQAWIDSHNLFKVIGVGIAKAVDDWVHWMGYFTSNFLMAIPPNVFGERMYVITAWIMLAMLSLSTIYLLYNIFVKIFQADKYVSHCVSMVMLFITVQCMVGRVEAFYWYSGAANYMFLHGMSLFFYGLLIAIVYDKGRKRTAKLIGASLLGFFTGGGNQLTALNVAIILLTVIGCITYQKKWKEYRALALPIGLFFLGFLLNVAAPGNWVRADSIEGMNPIKAVFVSLYYGLLLCLDQWLRWPIILMVILLIPLFWHMARKTAFAFRYPFIIVAFGYCVVSAMLTPALFAVGNIAAMRLQALTFAMFILVLTLCVGYVTGWARKRLEHSRQEEKADTEMTGFTRNEAGWLLGGLVFFTAASLIIAVPEPQYFATASAMQDIINGDAKAYGDTLKARIEIYNSGEKNVEVDALPARPELLYFDDIEEDPRNWKNQGVCRYYGIDSVTVIEGD